MDQEIANAIVSSFIDELVSKSSAIFSALADEGKALFKVGLKKYLERQYDRYSHIKTLLKGNTPVNLYDIYCKLDLMNGSFKIDTTVIANVFMKVNCATIIGDAGSGKSTLVKHLFINAIATKYAVPVLIELRYLNDFDGSFETYITKKILETEVSENENILAKLLAKGVFVFFLDGYDELKSDAKKKIVESINNFVTNNEKNKYIITSRPYSDIEQLQQFTNMKIKPLSHKSGEIDAFIKKQLDGEIELAQKIIESIVQTDSDVIKSFLKNPLLLTLYILTYQSNASIPDKKYIFYRRVINALFSEHDSKTKLGFVREMLCELTQEAIEEILKIYCFLSYFESKYDWDVDYINSKLKIIKDKKEIQFSNQHLIYDLKSAIALWIEDNGIYEFAHRSLQEYFAALFVKDLNPIDNERIYGKILEKLNELHSINEVENFLSLLEEMDTLNFHKYYYLPVLNELRKKIDITTDEKLVESTITFFILGFILDGKKNTSLKAKLDYNWRDVSKSMYIHLPITRALNKFGA